MKTSNNLRYGISLLSTIFLLFGSTFAMDKDAIAKPPAKPLKNGSKLSKTQGKIVNTNKLVFNSPSPTGNPKPNGTAGGREGDRCPKLRPQAITYDQGFQTASDRPAFWVYLPYNVVEQPTRINNQNEISTKAWIRLIVRRIDTKGILYKSERLPYPLVNPGLTRFTLPDNQQLVPNVMYGWSVEIYCMGDLNSSVITDLGLVKRVNRPNGLDSVVLGKATIEQLQIYGENGLWYETIDEIFSRRENISSNPKINEYLSQLLNLAGISDPAVVKFPTSK